MQKLPVFDPTFAITFDAICAKSPGVQFNRQIIDAYMIFKFLPLEGKARLCFRFLFF